MELQLGLAISTTVTMQGIDLNRYEYDDQKKRWFDGEILNYDDHVPHTLPLFSKYNMDEDGDDKRDNRQNHSFIPNKSTDGDESSVIGWPPIKSWRKRKSYQITGNLNRTVEINNQCRRGSNSTYVKVKMEGVGIARKVDLSLYHSYQTLTNTLIPMFGKCVENVKAYKLTYQDKEGDWLLAGDLPWGTFTRSVQCLKLLKNDG